jgi:co-chaperonin GroES (HSP10)
MAINVKPLGDRVLVQPLEEKEVKHSCPRRVLKKN